MVSIWPFKAESSAATFEKTLSTLATKIERTSAKTDNLRRSSRRAKAVWTLYTTFAYIFALIILTLVIGWENWQVEEYGAVAGSPIIIFGVRYALSTYYNYRISSAEAHLSTLVKERDDTIEKLKAATKYNSIKQLVEKYGDEPSSQRASLSRASPSASGGKRKADGDVSGNNVRKTNFKPPPTANIPVNRPPQQQPMMTEQQRQQLQLMPTHPDQLRSLSSSPYPASLHPSRQPSSTSLSPNTNLGTQSQYPPTSLPPSSSVITQHPTSHWYDRILDILLGEDETQPKNRFALICTSCRLVNGQAPPGTRQLSDIGQWRCGGCGSWNGVESEAESLVAQIQKDADGDNGATGRRRTRRNREEIMENDKYDKTSSNEDSSGDNHEANNNSTRAPTARTTMISGSESDLVGEPESETIRDFADDGIATGTGYSRAEDQTEKSSVRSSTRSKRKKNKS